MRVCVIGAGTMGSGIAAQMANIGFSVDLLDVTQNAVTDAFERARSARPPLFYTPDNAARIRLGSIAENLSWVAEADWVCEAVVERSDVKRALYAQIEPYLGSNAKVSTNTSGLEISRLVEGRSDSFRRRFLGAHFFNPPRYLKLLELIPTAETEPAAVVEFSRFLEEFVGRRVVVAKDTPGFIANRYGMWCMFHAIHVAERLHLTVEEVDAITGVYIGRPRSASFRLNDIVGLDVMRDIASNLLERCPEDPNVAVFQTPSSMLSLLSRGWMGDKTGHGYYRREGKETLVLDLQTYAYRQQREVTLPSLTQFEGLPLGERLQKALELRDEAGEFLRLYLVPALRYADALKAEISHSIVDFDRVMQWGFGWQLGPFAQIDLIGPKLLGIDSRPYYHGGNQLDFHGAYVPIRSEPEYANLVDFRVIGEAETYRLRDLGDGVAAVGFTTKLGVITPRLISDLTKLFSQPEHGRYVLASEARSFSAGFDLRFFLDAISSQRWGDIEEALLGLQKLGELLEKTNCVAAIHGHCLGAGLELALSCPQIVALAETNVGLPETRVGLIPGGRGVTLTRSYNQSNAKRLAEVSMTLTRGEIAPTADHARVLGYLRPTDLTVYHPDRLMVEAKRAALVVGDLKRPAWTPVAGPLMGMIDRSLDAATSRGELTEYDNTIGHKIKQIFARSMSYQDSLERERSEFLDLCSRAPSQARIRHMLETGKPLRN